MNCLYIGTPFERKIKSGADVINKRNATFLYTYYDQLDYFFTEDPLKRTSKLTTLKNILFYDNFVGLTKADIVKLCASIHKKI